MEFSIGLLLTISEINLIAYMKRKKLSGVIQISSVTLEIPPHLTQKGVGGGTCKDKTPVKQFVNRYAYDMPFFFLLIDKLKLVKLQVIWRKIVEAIGLYSH